MPNRTTYYTEREKEAIEQLADEQDESFSGVVRQAIQEVYNL